MGEIIDESDHPIEELWPQKDGAVHALATIDLRKLSQYLGIPWKPDIEVNTLGGLVASSLDRIPRKGDVVYWSDYRLEVLSATETRAEVVKLEQIHTDTPPIQQT